MKKILGLPKFYSNHVACSALDAYTFKHFINIKILRFAFWLKIFFSEFMFLFFETLLFSSSSFMTISITLGRKCTRLVMF